MRAVTNSLLVFLLLGALLCGNCLSCPQLLISLASHAPAHGCCKHPGKQPVTSQNECQSFALRHFVKADPAPKAQLQAAAYAHLAGADTQPLTPAAPRLEIVVSPYSPPDLEVLNSSIRV
jgi:hypothetical protein